MEKTPHLTEGFDAITARSIALTEPGMAHFAATGPLGETCSNCGFWGYWKQRRNKSGDVIDSNFRKACCKKYHALTGQHGPAIPPATESCRHFQPRDQ